MTKRSIALISFVLLACATAQAAPGKKHAPAPSKDVAAQDIDVDAMARAKDAGAKPAADATDAAPAVDAHTSASAEEQSTPMAEPSAAANDDVTEPKGEPPASAAAATETPSPLAPTSGSPDVDKSIAAGCESRAKGLLDAAQKGDYAGATRDFDAKMRTALPVPKFKQAWESLAQFGTLQARGQAHPMKGEGYIAITVPLIFDKANLYAQVACGSDGRIAGFYIKPL